MLHRRQDDIRLLKLEVAEAARRVLVTGKLRGIIPGLDLDMASLQKQLLETRRTGDELALQLESPDNKTRWAITPMAYALGWHCHVLPYHTASCRTVTKISTKSLLERVDKCTP